MHTHVYIYIYYLLFFWGGWGVRGIREISRKNPEMFREISGKCPGIVREMSGKNLGNFRGISGKCPENVREKSRKFPVNFRDISGKFPGKFRAPSGDGPDGTGRDGRVVVSYFPSFGGEPEPAPEPGKDRMVRAGTGLILTDDNRLVQVPRQKCGNRPYRKSYTLNNYDPSPKHIPNFLDFFRKFTGSFPQQIRKIIGNLLEIHNFGRRYVWATDRNSR